MEYFFVKRIYVYLVIFFIAWNVRGEKKDVFYTHPEFTVYADHIERNGCEASVDEGNGGIRSSASFGDKYYHAPDYQPKMRSEAWSPSGELKDLPSLRSAYPVIDSVYKMALQVVLDMVNAPPSGVLNASAGRPPWVRDTSYVILDGMTYLFPSACKKSLEYTANEKSTIKPEQMYGAMGWSSIRPGVPVLQQCYAMSDFVVWAPAAMEYVLTAQDRAFLEKYYDCICRTAELVRNEKYDRVDGLYDGGETIGDGSTAYPENTVGTVALKGSSVNFLHYQLLRTLVRAGEMLNKPVAERKVYQSQAALLEDAINRDLWINDRGFYSLLKQGRDLYPEERASAMANAFAILFNAATPEQKSRILQNFPDQKWGAPVLWPAWMNRVAYHDQNMWPNVDANWAVAAALAGDPDRLTKSLAIFSENAAFELGFTEMINLFQGNHCGKKPQLWAATGFLRMIIEGVFGLEAYPQGLIIQPNVPNAFNKDAELTGLQWGASTLNIRIKGSGPYIQSFLLDNKESLNLIPSDLAGVHEVRIVMTDKAPVKMDAPFAVPQNDPVTVLSENATALYVLFGETGDLQKLAPVSKGIFVINWPPEKVVDRITVLPADEGFMHRGRWQMINVKPQLETEFISGVYENKRPLKEGVSVNLTLRLCNNRNKPETVSVKLQSESKSIQCPDEVMTMEIPANGEKRISSTIQLNAGLSYGSYPVVAEILKSGELAEKAIYSIEINEVLDLRGIWAMKGTEQENAADPALYERPDGWRFVNLPEKWEDYDGYKDYDGVMWYRKTVLVPSAWKGHDLEFHLRSVSGEDTAYFNGVMIGFGDGKEARNYKVPSDIVKEGEDNVIAVKVFNKSTWPKSGLTDWPMELRVLPYQTK